MSQKQKVLAGVVAVAVIAGFGFVYTQFSTQREVSTVKNFQVNTEMTSNQTPSQARGQAAAAIPATPDATVDTVIDDALLDDQVLQSEVSSEQDAVTASGSEINNLSQTYDENQL